MFDPIIVVGPGRCGSSAVAGILNHLGVFMGEDFVSANETNPYGHWEDKNFRDLNDDLLFRRITQDHWHYCLGPLINKRRSLKVAWGWKDPRTCHLLPQYLTHFREPKFIRCKRNPSEIEKSMLKAYAKQGLGLERVHEIREYRERQLDKHLLSYPTCEIEFDQLMRDPERNVRAIVDFLDIITLSEEQVRKAVDFIQPRGKRQRFDTLRSRTISIIHRILQKLGKSDSKNL